MTSVTPAALPAPLHYRALQELKLVDDITETVEYSTEESSSETGVRCFQPWLGTSMFQPENITCRRCMEYARDHPPHQLQGASCSMVGASMLCFEPAECIHTSLDGRHSSSGLCEQNGWPTEILRLTEHLPSSLQTRNGELNQIHRNGHYIH